jgi:hypothetical protein
MCQRITLMSGGVIRCIPNESHTLNVLLAKAKQVPVVEDFIVADLSDPLEMDFFIDQIWSLEAYLNWLNRNHADMPLVQDLDHWADYGIVTARQLADYLDSCTAEHLAEELLYERASA